VQQSSPYCERKYNTLFDFRKLFFPFFLSEELSFIFFILTYI